MKYTRLGARGPQVSTIGFGSWAISGLHWGPTDDRVSKRALHEALEQGVSLIDTSDNYGHGHSEKLIAEVLAERGRTGVVLATKAGSDFYNATKDDDGGYGPIRMNADKDYIVFACEQSLRRLRVDCIDILQLHSHPTAMLERDDPWEALALLKQQGKIRHAGWSIMSFKETESVPLLERHADLLDVIQVRYNLLEREAERALFPAALRHGIGVIARIPILFGLLAGKFDRTSRFGEDDHRRMNLSPEKLDAYLAQLESLQPLYDAFPKQSKVAVSLRFCISHPAVQTAIPGAKTPEQVLQNCAASDLGPLPPSVIPAFE
jgi:aryl-alcohol dehydrogenase-like predicted oxidoreductase